MPAAACRPELLLVNQLSCYTHATMKAHTFAWTKYVTC
jgi:hypothetical protein